MAECLRCVIIGWEGFSAGLWSSSPPRRSATSPVLAPVDGELAQHERAGCGSPALHGSDPRHRPGRRKRLDDVVRRAAAGARANVSPSQAETKMTGRSRIGSMRSTTAIPICSPPRVAVTRLPPPADGPPQQEVIKQTEYDLQETYTRQIMSTTVAMSSRDAAYRALWSCIHSLLGHNTACLRIGRLPGGFGDFCVARLFRKPDGSRGTRRPHRGGCESEGIRRWN